MKLLIAIRSFYTRSSYVNLPLTTTLMEHSYLCHAAMLDNTSPFTDVSNSIYSNGLGTGWSTAPANNSVTLAVQEAGAGLQGSAGLCINVTYTKVNDCLVGL